MSTNGLRPPSANPAEFIGIWLDEDKAIAEVAGRMVASIGDYAPTAAAFKGDMFLRLGNTERQHFWLKVTLCSSQILYLQECSARR